MPDISLETVTGKLNRVGYDAFIQALRKAKAAGNRNLELAHWLSNLLRSDRTDLSKTADFFKLDRARLLSDVERAVESLRKNETEMPGVSNVLVDLLDRGWHYSTLFFGEAQIRTGHVLVAAFKSMDLKRAFISLSPEFSKINVETLPPSTGPSGWGRMRRTCARWMDRALPAPVRLAPKRQAGPRARRPSTASRRT